MPAQSNETTCVCMSLFRFLLFFRCYIVYPVVFFQVALYLLHYDVCWPSHVGSILQQLVIDNFQIFNAQQVCRERVIVNAALARCKQRLDKAPRQRVATLLRTTAFLQLLASLRAESVVVTSGQAQQVQLVATAGHQRRYQGHKKHGFIVGMRNDHKHVLRRTTVLRVWVGVVARRQARGATQQHENGNYKQAVDGDKQELEIVQKSEQYRRHANAEKNVKSLRVSTKACLVWQFFFYCARSCQRIVGKRLAMVKLLFGLWQLRRDVSNVAAPMPARTEFSASNNDFCSHQSKPGALSPPLAAALSTAFCAADSSTSSASSCFCTSFFCFSTLRSAASCVILARRSGSGSVPAQ